jgi:hypothetical protein
MTRFFTRKSFQIDYKCLAAAALPYLPQLLQRWLPDGCREGNEWVALNPTRNDTAHGSFKINLRTGCWSDFATGDRGGDVISLLAYLRGTPQSKAAQDLARELEVRS